MKMLLPLTRVAVAAAVAIAAGGCSSASHIATEVREPPTSQSGGAGVPAFAHYRALHAIPELGKQEVRTAQYVREHLRRAGITEFHEVAGLPTAVVAVLDSGRPGPTVCLRAELDARPGDEATGLPYRSQTAGLMHSCGHDAHTAMLLTLAEELAASRALSRGRLVFLFQPAEETPGGADDVVNDGILQRLGVKAIVAQHVTPGVPVGTVQVSPGPLLAGSSYFTVKVTGKGGHAAVPHEGDDVLLAAAQIIIDLSRLPARRIDVIQRPCVISVTHVAVGTERALNIRPAEAVFRGTIRAFENPDETPAGGRSLREIVGMELSAAAERHGVGVEFDLRRGPPPTVNDRLLYDAVVGSVRSALPNVAFADARRSMFAEDFAFYTAAIPCLYFSLGIDNGTLGREGVHTDKFTVAPESLDVGVSLLRASAEAMIQRVE